MSKKHLQILFFANCFYICGIGFLAWLKYQNFWYNGLDLAIFSNFFYNLSFHFSSFSSIQGHTYLGDHITPFALALVPLFTIIPHPLTLVFSQIIAISLTSLVIYALTKQLILQKKASLSPEKWALGTALIWLCNPLLINTALFEFHIIVFALPLIFGAYLFYIQKRFIPFVLLLVLACFVREDVSLVVASFGVIAWIERAPWRYRLVPLLFGIGYFFITLWLLGQSHETFRFFVYYSWLGNTFSEILTTLVTKPHIWLAHIFSMPLLDMLIGLFFPFLLLPLLKPKYLLLTLLPFLQFALGESGASGIIVMSHYSVLFIPGLVLASLDAGMYLSKKNNHPLYRLVNFDLRLSQTIMIGFFILVGIFFSTLHTIPHALTTLNNQTKKTALAQQILHTIPKDAVIACTYSALPNLSTRTSIYSMHYILLGTQQFSSEPYVLEPKPMYVYFDLEDILLYDLQMQSYTDPAFVFHSGIKRIQNVLQSYTPTWHAKNITTWQRSKTNTGFDAHLYPTATPELTCTDVEHGLGNTYHCSILEPNNAVYSLAITYADGTDELVPFVWRDYTNTSKNHPAYARFMTLHTKKIQKIAVITRTGFVVLGDLLRIEPFETHRQTVQTVHFE